MNSIKSSEIKKPTSPKASGQSRAGCYSAEGAWISVYDAALRGVEEMTGPVTPRCECASKCRLYPWCCADWHLCGLGGVGGGAEFVWEALSGHRSQHPICNTGGQLVGPLIDRLVGNAYRLCCGCDGAAQQFDGF